jgi:hypothetical protein
MKNSEHQSLEQIRAFLEGNISKVTCMSRAQATRPIRQYVEGGTVQMAVPLSVASSLTEDLLFEYADGKDWRAAGVGTALSIESGANHGTSHRLRECYGNPDLL